jgi:hypothetical protein
MLSGSLLAVFWVLIALIGAISGLVCVMGWGKGR